MTRVFHFYENRDFSAMQFTPCRFFVWIRPTRSHRISCVRGYALRTHTMKLYDRSSIGFFLLRNSSFGLPVISHKIENTYLVIHKLDWKPAWRLPINTWGYMAQMGWWVLRNSGNGLRHAHYLLWLRSLYLFSIERIYISTFFPPCEFGSYRIF